MEAAAHGPQLTEEGTGLGTIDATGSLSKAGPSEGSSPFRWEVVSW